MLKKGLVAGVINLILSFSVNWAIGAIFPTIAEEYQNSGLFRSWSDPLMTVYFAYPFVLAFVLAYLWGRVQNQLSGTSIKKALEFAKFYFIIATIPGMFITYTSFQVSPVMVLSWTITGFVEAFVTGLIFIKI